MRLCNASVDQLPSSVVRLDYDRTVQKSGIVHFGIGAFHRAHQSVYTDDAMAAGDRDWAITGVSLRSAEVADQMNPQDGLYTVTQRSGEGEQTRLIGAVTRVIVATRDPMAVIDAIASPDTHIVTFTITEKGYHRRVDGGLDIAAQAVTADLAGNGAPSTIYGFLAAAFARRKAAGLPGLSLLSCDNLADNGARLAALLGDYLQRIDPSLADWFTATCTCPSTMVDRIVPATHVDDLDVLEAALGLRDQAAVITEPFRQWVIEDRFAGPRPQWETAGVQLVADVRPYETAKLRMLNGAHSALAYLGLAQGHDYVHQAIADPALLPLIDQLMRYEAAASLDVTPEQDLMAYADMLMARFANPALPHRLMQIAMDGSEKIPQRWLEPLAINRAAGRECPATLAALASWILHVRGDRHQVDDPMARVLAELWQRLGADDIAAGMFGEGGLFSRWWVASFSELAILSQEIGHQRSFIGKDEHFLKAL